MSLTRKKPLRRKGFDKSTLDRLLGEGKIIRAKDAKPLLRKAFGKKSQKSPRTKAMADADKWFSQFIRLRDSDENGRVKCVTCSHTGHWKQLQNGHFVTRGHMATRFDEQNCNTQCRGCNYNGGQHLKHAMAIDWKFGPGTYEKIEQRGRMRCSRSLDDLLYIAAQYKAKVEEMQQDSPGKFLWQSA